MQPLCVSVALLGIVAQLVRAEGIIGADGKELRYVGHRAHRDGLHDQVLHNHEAHDRRHDLSHPRLRQVEYSHVPHMLNQAPIIVSQDSLHIVSNSHHFRRLGSGADNPPSTVAATTGNASHGSEQDAPSLGSEREHSTIVQSATALNRMEQKKMDSGDGYTAEEDKHAVKRDQNFHFRAGHKQSEQNAAEDLTAQEVERERKTRQQRMRKSKASAGAAPATAPAAAAPSAAAPGGAPAPAPMASPAGSPEAAEENEAYNSHSTMDEDIGAQEQGFSGELVEHDNMKTMTKDWRGEYGPGYDGMHSFVKICAMYPDNQWCRDRGYHKPTSPPKSAALRPATGAVLVAAFCGFLLA